MKSHGQDDREFPTFSTVQLSCQEVIRSETALQ
jgi:hypothetical protein